MNNSRVAILVPTKDRAKFIERQLKFYAERRSPHPIYIGDASSSSEAEKIQRICREFSGKLELHYLPTPGLLVPDTMCRLLDQVKEPYVCFCGDDDFQIPATLTMAGDFLAQDRSYATARGHAVIFSLDPDQSTGWFDGLSLYRQPELTQELASERIGALMQNYFCPQFSVSRTAETRSWYKQAIVATQRSLRDELIPSCLAIVTGKSKLLDRLGFIREDHPNRNLQGEFESRLKDKAWEPSREIFLESVAATIATKDNVALSRAREIATAALNLYISNSLARDNAKLSVVLVLKQKILTTFKPVRNWARMRRRHRLEKAGGPNGILSPGSKDFGEFSAVCRLLFS